MCDKGKNGIPKLQDPKEEGREYKDQAIDGFQVYCLYCLETILCFKKVSQGNQRSRLCFLAWAHDCVFKTGESLPLFPPNCCVAIMMYVSMFSLYFSWEIISDFISSVCFLEFFFPPFSLSITLFYLSVSLLCFCYRSLGFSSDSWRF